MADFNYNNFLEHCLGRTSAVGTRHHFDTGTIKCGIVSGADYTEAATHNTWDDVGTYALDQCYNTEATQTLSNKTMVDGVFDNAATLTFTAVAIDGAKVVDAIIYYLSTGTITLDTLILFQDSGTTITPNGGDITVTPHASGIFAL